MFLIYHWHILAFFNSSKLLRLCTCIEGGRDGDNKSDELIMRESLFLSLAEAIPWKQEHGWI